MDIQKIRQDFPIFQKRQGLVYFDSACTTLKPRQVLEAQRAYNEEYSGCAGRSAHAIARQTSDAFEAAREKVAKFVNAKPDSVAWTRNTTEGLNLDIRALDYSKRKKIVTTRLEHHSILLPIFEQRRRADVQPTVDQLHERATDLARTLAALERDLDAAAEEKLDARIAALELEPPSSEQERRLGLLQRQRQTVHDLGTRRTALESQLEACLLAMQNVRFDLLRLRSAGVAEALGDLTQATQQARALSRDVDAAVSAAAEI
ncbi:MAG TPA: aminotransferase class V-fold PLP-dependent enzyme, partial [Candidatus Micrarchaeota archaeon]|nr:aminotransferase class V-fold PLP-dependent enzyme [Candidatus Micrarchaeota archaeon]